MRLNCAFLLLFTLFYPLHLAFPCLFFLSAVTRHQETTPGSAGYAKARHHPTPGWCPVHSHRYRAPEAWLHPDDLHAQLWRLQKPWFVPCQFSGHQWTVTPGGFTSETQKHSSILKVLVPMGPPTFRVTMIQAQPTCLHGCSKVKVKDSSCGSYNSRDFKGGQSTE